MFLSPDRDFFLRETKHVEKDEEEENEEEKELVRIGDGYMIRLEGERRRERKETIGSNERE